MKFPMSHESGPKTPELPRSLKKLANLSEDDAYDFISKNHNKIEEEVQEQKAVPRSIGEKFLTNPYGYEIILSHPDRFVNLDHEKLLFAVGKYFSNPTLKQIDERLASVEKLGVSRSEIAFAVLRSGGYSSNTAFITDNIKHFTGLDLKKFADELFATDNGHHVEYYWDVFSEAIEPQELYERLIKEAVSSSDKRFFFLHAADLLQKVPALDPTPLAEAILQTQKFEIFNEKLPSFWNIKEEVLTDMLVTVGHPTFFNIIEHLDQFTQLTNQSSLVRAIMKNRKNALLSLSFNLFRFKNLDSQIALDLINDEDNDNRAEVIKYLRVFSNPNYNLIYETCIEKGLATLVVNNIEKGEVQGIDERMVRALYEDWGNSKRGEKSDESWNIKKLRVLHVYAQETFHITLDKNIDALAGLVGSEQITEGFYKMFVEYSSAHGMEAAKKYFQEGYQEVRKICLDPNIGPQELRRLLTEPHKTFATVLTRFDGSQWGEHDNVSFEKIVQTVIQSLETNNLQQETLPAKDVTISRVQLLERPKRMVDGFAERYQGVVEDIQWAVEQRNRPLGQGLRQLVEMASSILTEHEKELKRGIKGTENVKAITNLTDRLKLIESVERHGEKQRPRFGHSDEERTKNIAPLLKSLVQLSKGKLKSREHQLVRRAAFLVAAMNNSAATTDISQISSDSASATQASVSRIIEFMQHVTFQETFAGGGGRPALLADESLKDLEKTLGTGVLQEQLVQFEGGSSKETSTFRIIPTRSLGLELSGHMGDACWASKYELISKQFPNISALNFVLEPVTKNERIAGSCLILKTTVDKKPVIIIRGLNPIENVINRHDPASFVREIVRYLESENKDTKVAIVIDDHAGGSSTNRPVLFSYLDRLRGKLAKVPLKEGSSLTFNDYNITKDTFYVDSASVS